MSYRRKARLSIDVIERQVFLPSITNSLFTTLSMYEVPDVSDLTPIYTVEVQVKILWFWISVWEENCEYSDADSRTRIDAKAREVYESITKEI